MYAFAAKLKIDTGPGYRVDFTRRSVELIVPLCGGDKNSQSRDIEAAKKLALLVLKGQGWHLRLFLTMRQRI
jgi:putative addiction module killer protein